MTPATRARWRTPVLITLLVLVTAAVLVATAAPTARGLLDPAAVDEPGSRAVAELLRAEGVTVDLARTVEQIRAAGPDATVLVPFPAALGPGRLAALRGSAADLVLITPGADALAELAPGVEVVALRSAEDTREPACLLPAASSAGAATAGGELYRAPDAITCYPGDDADRDGADGDGADGDGADGDGDGAALVVVEVDGRTVTVLGTPQPLTNRALPAEGNAALALNLLGAHPRLLWYLPPPEGPAAGTGRDPTDLIPAGWGWAAAQLGIAVLLAALWRGRRLGPVVVEPLPVVVRAAEAVEGRGRLYRRAGALGHAADALRAATRSRLAPLLGAGRTDPATPDAGLVASVATRTGRTGVDVHDLLYGSAPPDDAALVALATALDTCEREVRRS